MSNTVLIVLLVVVGILLLVARYRLACLGADFRTVHMDNVRLNALYNYLVSNNKELRDKLAEARTMSAKLETEQPYPHIVLSDAEKTWP